MTSNLQTNKRPHAVCVPFPAQGHLNPMLNLAKLLHHKGFHITYVNTHFNRNRLLRSRGPDAVAGLPDFRLESIPDGLPPSDADATQFVPSLCDSTRKTCLGPFRQLLRKLKDESSSNSSNVPPPVSCIVSDSTMFFTGKAADELGIPNVYLWTASACSFLGYLYYPQLIEKGLTPLKDESYMTNGYLDTIVNWIPGLEGIRLKDLPSFIRTTDPNDMMIDFALEVVDTSMHKASSIILNTFEELDHQVLEALSSILPPIYPIGPLHLLVNQISDHSMDSICSNLWEEELECLQWLNTKKHRSVVYVNFGSITTMSPKQLEEFAWGLANSEKPFVWVIRPDLVMKGDLTALSNELLTKIKEVGIMISWCPQEKVLSHPSIGGFLTHSGWNSTIESLSAGVPVVCWPFFADQQTNCWSSCNEWGIGMEIDSNVKRDEVENLVREILEGEKGKKMREKAMEWKRKAENAVGPGGSSLLNFEKMISNAIFSPQIPIPHLQDHEKLKNRNNNGNVH